jgi:hypothetical protein
MKTATLKFTEENFREKLTIDGHVLRRAIDQHVEELVEKMNSLRDELDREITRFQEEGIEHSFNSLGIVQGRGTEIDRLCGELDVLKEVLRNSGVWKESWRK